MQMKTVLSAIALVLAIAAPSQAAVPVTDTTPTTIRELFLYNKGHGSKHVVVRRQDSKLVLFRTIMLDGEEMAFVERLNDTNGPCGVALEVSVDNGTTFHPLEVEAYACQRGNPAPFALVVYDKGGVLTTIDPD
jgi:hypothetical protein